MNREIIKQFDSLAIAEVAKALPRYADSRVERRYQSVSSKRIAAWLRFPRTRGDGLFECLHFARDYADDTGFLYSAEAYLNFFPELTFPPGPFGDYLKLHEILPTAFDGRGGVEPLGEYCGAGWYLLGRDLDSALQRLANVLKAFSTAAVPHLDALAKALLQDPVLVKAFELSKHVDPVAEDSRERIISSLRPLGETDRRGYPIGKIAGQLVWRRRGNKNWHQV